MLDVVIVDDFENVKHSTAGSNKTGRIARMITVVMVVILISPSRERDDTRIGTPRRNTGQLEDVYIGRLVMTTSSKPTSNETTRHQQQKRRTADSDQADQTFSTADVYISIAEGKAKPHQQCQR